jgi:CBS domain-containing protein
LKRLPVVAENGRLVGWVSRVDILRALEQERPLAESIVEGETSVETLENVADSQSSASIADLMYQDVPTVLPQAKLEEIVQALEQNSRSRVVVVDDQQQVLGIITDGDLLRRIQPEARSGLVARLQGKSGGLQLAGTETAETLMTAPVITISIDAAPSEALPLMLQHGIKRIPVVDQNGRLLGLLGRGNLLSGLVLPA